MMMDSKKSTIVPTCVILGLLSATSIGAEEGGPNPDYTPLSPLDYGPESDPGNEVTDIVFVIDGSSSINNGGFPLQKEGIANCLVGPNAFIPHNGTVAIAVIQFADSAREERSLTVIDSEQTAASVADEIRNIVQMGFGTDLAAGLTKAIDVFETEAYGGEFILIVSTDINDPINP